MSSEDPSLEAFLGRDVIEIDGADGEGGGQILRTALALALCTSQPFRISNIRAGRQKPGLLRQHLTAVRAATEVGRAEVEGAELGARELTFRPRAVRAGKFAFAVGTAGSATLVFQTILPALAIAKDRSEVRCEGGTHNPFAPPWDFLERCLVPQLRRMGPKLGLTLERRGFFPAGGGAFSAVIEPVEKWAPLQLLERGESMRRAGRIYLSGIPLTVGARERTVLCEKLNWAEDCVAIESCADSAGPGNAVVAEVESARVTEVATGFGVRGVPAEEVAQKVVDQLRRYLAVPAAAVGEHLADQLLVPQALAGGGEWTSIAPTRHSLTNCRVIARFLPVRIDWIAEEAGAYRCRVGADDSAGASGSA